jgi:hypothetical protein
MQGLWNYQVLLCNGKQKIIESEWKIINRPSISGKAQGLNCYRELWVDLLWPVQPWSASRKRYGVGPPEAEAPPRIQGAPLLSHCKQTPETVEDYLLTGSLIILPFGICHQTDPDLPNLK